tara:strand:+ start:1111 stop:1452 length:342 start_codon:yes stop_codon:yes gene_type:complete
MKAKMLKRGFSKKCPNCGISPLFPKYLKTYKKCEECGIDFTKYKSDDGPAYCTVFILGHIIIPIILLTEKNFSIPLVFQMTFWPLVTVVSTLWLLPKIKGAFIGLQISVKDSN